MKLYYCVILVGLLVGGWLAQPTPSTVETSPDIRQVEAEYSAPPAAAPHGNPDCDDIADQLAVNFIFLYLPCCEAGYMDWECWQTQMNTWRAAFKAEIKNCIGCGYLESCGHDWEDCEYRCGILYTPTDPRYDACTGACYLHFLDCDVGGGEELGTKLENCLNSAGLIDAMQAGFLSCCTSPCP